MAGGGACGECRRLGAGCASIEFAQAGRFAFAPISQKFELAAAGGLEFGEVALKGKSIHAATEPFWELKRSVTLPKMANAHQFIHPGKTEAIPFTGDYAKIIMISDPPFRTGEVHYRRGDLQAVGPFDIARTFEKYMEIHPALVISQRFYQFCLQHKLPLDVEPVRIDPD